MKRLLTTTFVLCFFCFIAQAQTDTLHYNKSLSDERDSLLVEYFSAQQTYQPHFKLYKTENTWILLKLNTTTGAVWMVQYGKSDEERMQILIGEALVMPWDESVLNRTLDSPAGRFELYPTNNIYNFILLDTFFGYTYQVQWSTDLDKVFRKPIPYH